MANSIIEIMKRQAYCLRDDKYLQLRLYLFFFI